MSAIAADLQELEAKLGHVFRDRSLLVRALTHSSFSSESKAGDPHPDNEQLEFFGDSLLGFLVSELLVVRFPGATEGRLSLAKSNLVSAKHLFHVAKSIGLGEYLQLGHGEEMSGGRAKKSLLSDAVEALIAAMYLDGGIDAPRAFVSAHVWDEAALLPAAESENYKGRLWEYAGAGSLPKPEYAVVEETGPMHQRHFVVEVRLGKANRARGEGHSKKSASQAAAKQLLAQLTQ